MTYINRGGTAKDIKIHWISDQKNIHYSIKGVLTSLPLYATIEGMYDKFEIDIVSDDELIKILGLDFEKDEGLEYEHNVVKEIVLCSGTWKRIENSSYWAFEFDNYN